MSSSEFGAFALPLLLFLVTAHLCGVLFVRLRQPRVVGEILAGVLLGPAVFGHFAPAAFGQVFGASPRYQAVIGFLYNLGLLLLMFASGAESRGLFRSRDRRAVAWLAGVGTALPFLAVLIAAPLVPLDGIQGTAAQPLALVLVVGIAVAVTSIPVVSKIFHDLGILQTRFARLILGVAVIEDIALWGVLAVATALATTGGLPSGAVVRHVALAVVYFALGLTLLPYLVRRVSAAPWNVLVRSAPLAYAMTVLLAYTAVAAALGVNLVFGAFLAGYALVSAGHLRDATEALGRVSFAVFIPLYFAVVGYQLDLGRSLSVAMVVVFLGLACLIKLVSAGLGARLAGFPWRDTANLAVTLNARGGPGIVLASVAYDANIINASFYTTLVLVAIVTSQAAGAWLDRLVRRGRPLLTAAEGGEEAVGAGEGRSGLIAPLA